MSTEPESERPADSALVDDVESDISGPVDDHAAAAIEIDPEHVGGPAFWIGLVVGWAVIIGGIRVGMHDREVKPTLLLKWLGGALILHDAIWLPLLALVGAVGTFVIRRRVPPFVAWAVMTSAVLTLIAWPFVRGYGRRADVPSALQRNYAHGLLAYIGVTWVIALIALAIDTWHRRRAAH